MLGAIFEPFVKNSPISVMARGLLDRVLNPERLDELFERDWNQQAGEKPTVVTLQIGDDISATEKQEILAAAVLKLRCNILDGIFELLLANARHIKQVPGRKTDVSDCQWIAQLLQHGLLRGSCVPGRPQRELRDLTRHRAQLAAEHARVANLANLDPRRQTRCFVSRLERLGCEVTLTREKAAA